MDVLIDTIGKVFLDVNKPIKERMKALFNLKQSGKVQAIDWISKCFGDKSVLLKHEAAYCLGQMENPHANPVLMNLLEDRSQDAMVRHEAAEALGAIGSKESLQILSEYCSDPIEAVAETCQIACQKIEWLHQNSDGEKNLDSVNPFLSVDPAPPLKEKNIQRLKEILIDEEETLFNRYRAMFALRNLNNDESVLALVEGLRCGSILFRHEIAYVLGQIQNACSITGLKDSLEDESENEMVRHECAEALGSIATQECFDILEKYAKDETEVIKESVEVALDLLEYAHNEEIRTAEEYLIEKN